MAKSEGKGESKGAAKADGKIERKSEAPAAPPKSWAQQHAGTFYIVGAFGVVVLIAVLRASCN